LPDPNRRSSANAGLFLFAFLGEIYRKSKNEEKEFERSLQNGFDSNFLSVVDYASVTFAADEERTACRPTWQDSTL